MGREITTNNDPYGGKFPRVLFSPPISHYVDTKAA